MNTTGIPTTVEDLQARWATLHDLDRAESVQMIQKRGTSIRSLAKELGCCTESHLVQRSKLAATAEAEKTRASEAERHVKESKTWSTRICRWLQEQNLAWAHQENIIEEVQRLLMLADISGELKNVVAPKGVSLNEIIGRTRPKESDWRNLLEINFYIGWLAYWTVFAIPDQIVRDMALADALLRVRTGEAIRSKRAAR